MYFLTHCKTKTMKTEEAIETISPRQQEILESFHEALDRNIEEVKNGQADGFYELREIADLLHIHPGHLSNTIKQTTGMSSCAIFEEKLMAVSRNMLMETDMPIGEIAMALSYDPSNFTKFFKHYEGITPKEFRKRVQLDAG